MTVQDSSKGSLFGVGRGIWLLTICQAIYYGVVSVDLTLTALAGLALAPHSSLATLPLGAISLTSTIGAFAGGWLAGRFGPLRLLTLGSSLGVVGGVVSAFAMHHGSFVWLCVGTAVVGFYRSTGAYIRYLAADLDSQRSRGLSFVLVGGVVAAFVGPFLATKTSTLFRTTYMGSYALVGLLCLLSILVEHFVANSVRSASKKAPAVPSDASVRGRQRRVNLIVGTFTLSLSGALMTMVMAIGPLASKMMGHSVSNGAMMIQWHLVAMFGPSLLGGALTRRFQSSHVGVMGGMVFVVGAVLGCFSSSPGAMIIAMVLNGFGWNLTFLAGSALVVSTYARGQGGKTQSVVEGISATFGVLAALSSSWAFVEFGWRHTNLGVLVCAAILSAVLLWNALVNRVETSTV